MSEVLAIYHKWSFQDCKKYIYKIKERTYISCWNISYNESDYMWENYTNNKTGIAAKRNKYILVKQFFIKTFNYSTRFYRLNEYFF